MPENRTLKCVKISLKAMVKLTKLARDESINEYCRAVLLVASSQGTPEITLRVAERPQPGGRQRSMLPREHGLSLRLMPVEWGRLERAAGQANLTLHEWVRLHLDHAAGLSRIADQIYQVRRAAV